MKIGKFLWEKVKLGKCSTKYEQFLKIGGNMKQGKCISASEGKGRPCLQILPCLGYWLLAFWIRSLPVQVQALQVKKKTPSYPLHPTHCMCACQMQTKATYLLTLVNCGNDHKHLFTVVIMHADICRPIGHNSPRFSHLCFSGCPCLSVSLSVYLSLYLSQGTSL